MPQPASRSAYRVVESRHLRASEFRLHASTKKGDVKQLRELHRDQHTSVSPALLHVPTNAAQMSKRHVKLNAIFKPVEEFNEWVGQIKTQRILAHSESSR